MTDRHNWCKIIILQKLPRIQFGSPPAASFGQGPASTVKGDASAS